MIFNVYISECGLIHTIFIITYILLLVSSICLDNTGLIPNQAGLD